MGPNYVCRVSAVQHCFSRADGLEMITSDKPTSKDPTVPLIHEQEETVSADFHVMLCKKPLKCD